jgi:hypothetical protein
MYDFDGDRSSDLDGDRHRNGTYYTSKRKL